MSASTAALFQRLTHGVYVIGVADGAEANAFTAAWLMQVSFDPLLVALSINPRHSSYAVLGRGRVFSVNVLASDQVALASHFGKPATAGKLSSVAWTPGTAGAPLLDDAAAWLECRPMHEEPAGDHVLVVAEVIGGRLLRPDAVPLSYRDTGDMDGAAALFPARFSER